MSATTAGTPPTLPAGGNPDRAPGAESGPRRDLGGGGPGGYGALVDAGPVLFALTPASQLIAFAPGGPACTDLARFKVADSPTHAYPIISGSRIIIKDQDSVTLWTLE